MATINEMTAYLLNNTDHSLVNELLASGMEWEKAVELAYKSIVK